MKVWTPEDGRVNIHPGSVNVNEKYFGSHYLTYHQKMRTTSNYLYDTTSIQPQAILFFGDRLQVFENRIIVGGQFEFRCERKTMDILLELRAALDKLLEVKFRNPNPIQWDDDEGTLVK